MVMTEAYHLKRGYCCKNKCRHCPYKKKRMKVQIELEQEDFNAMHDVIFEVLDTQPTDEQIQKVWNILPDHIQGDAIQWGASDSVFRDNMYVWIKENKDVVMHQIK